MKDIYKKEGRMRYTKNVIVILSLLLACVNLTATDFVIHNSGLDGVYASSLAWGDYNNDGFMDICISGISASGYITKIYNNFDGSFSDSGVILPGVGFSSVEWGDYDNDGDLDLFICGRLSDQQIIAKIYRNDDGIFTDINANITPAYGGSASWGDYNNDGRLDLIVSGINNSTQHSTILYTNTPNGFINSGINLPQVHSSSIKWGDYDNDSWLDLLITGIDENVQRISRVLHNTHGTFADINAPLVGVGNSSAAWGDYDNDGLLDIALSGRTINNQCITKVYHNIGGGFQDINAILYGVQVSSISWGDCDNDGDLDLLVTGGGSHISPFDPFSAIYINNGGVFSNIFTLSGVCFSSASWCDYNNDGALDVIISGRDVANNEVTLLYDNIDTGNNNQPSSPANLRTNEHGDYIIFQWNESIDTEQPSQSLTYAIRIGTTSGSCDLVSPMSLSNGISLKPSFGYLKSNCSFLISKSVFDSLSTYFWSCQAIDNSFTRSQFSPEESFSISSNIEDDIIVPVMDFCLEAYPNPFIQSTYIKFVLAKQSPISLRIYNLKGQLVADVYSGPLVKGSHSIVWDGKDNNGKSCNSGVYYCKIMTGCNAEVKKVILLR
ncbi:MAG: FG-GAP-like repeat-containing protein [Candidatus Cloacimonetes bacterium]|nr:FG-GAP-like repeat-containing protein [Candidatus Cloacimonadota bacterium]